MDFRNKNRMLTNIETFAENDIVYLLVPHASALQSNAQKFRQDYVAPLAIDTKIDDTHYLLKDITSCTLKGDYHINRLKRAGKNNSRERNKKLQTARTANGIASSKASAACPAFIFQ